jgi:membrane protein required for colicin V production
MNFLDIIILCFVGLLLVNGIRKGFIISLASLAALILGIYIAVHFSNYLEGFLADNLHPSRTWLPILSFSITFLIVVILVMLLGKALEKIVDLVGMGIFNHIFGGIFGLLKGIFLASIIFFLIHSIDQKEKMITPKAKEESLFYKPVAMIFPFLMKVFGGEITFLEDQVGKPEKGTKSKQNAVLK